MSDFALPIAKGEKVGPEVNPWWWNPSRFAANRAPEEFMGRLKAQMGDELEITWNPIIERWQIWSRFPKMNHPLCQGWRLLFIHNDRFGNYMPLDERVYARLWSASADQHGSGKAYFERIKREYERDEELKNKRLTQEAIDQAMPYFEHSQIKNIGLGSKFSTYHA